jgi:hypothetical protein
MRTPKSVRRADAKKNAVLDEKRSEKVIGDITILASQLLWGDNTTTRTICVYRTGAVREPWEDGYEEDIESYTFKDAGEANKKYMEIVRRYSK